MCQNVNVIPPLVSQKGSIQLYGSIDVRHFNQNIIVFCVSHKSIEKPHKLIVHQYPLRPERKLTCFFFESCMIIFYWIRFVHGCCPRHAGWYACSDISVTPKPWSARVAQASKCSGTVINPAKRCEMSIWPSGIRSLNRLIFREKTFILRNKEKEYLPISILK
jgi:hypothetical protein